MSQKLHAFISAALAEENSATPGHLVIRSDVLQRVDELHNVLVRKLASEKKKHMAFEHGGNTAAMDALAASPQMQLYQNLTRRASHVSSLQCNAPNVPELHKFSLLLFPNLIELKLDMCPLTTISGLYKLKHQLQHLEIVNTGICDLSQALVPFILDPTVLAQFKPALSLAEATAYYHSKAQGTTVKHKSRLESQYENIYEWNKLSTLKLSNCGLSRIDESLHVFPALTSLDVSKNDITFIVHLQDCSGLRHLNISRNRVATLTHVGQVLLNITTLNLSHNQLVTIEGIEKLIYLENVDLSANLIEDFTEIRCLCKLPSLDQIALVENPISKHQQYRLMVYHEFGADGSVVGSKVSLPHLDGLAMTAREYKSLRGVLFRSLGEESHGDGGGMVLDVSNEDVLDFLPLSPALHESLSVGAQGINSPGQIKSLGFSSPQQTDFSVSPRKLVANFTPSYNPPLESVAGSPQTAPCNHLVGDAVGLSPTHQLTSVTSPTSASAPLNPRNDECSSKSNQPDSDSARLTSTISKSQSSSLTSPTTTYSRSSPVPIVEASPVKRTPPKSISSKVHEVSALPNENNGRCNPQLLSGWKTKRARRKVEPRVAQIQSEDKEVVTYPNLEDVKKLVVATHTAKLLKLQEEESARTAAAAEALRAEKEKQIAESMAEAAEVMSSGVMDFSTTQDQAFADNSIIGGVDSESSRVEVKKGLEAVAVDGLMPITETVVIGNVSAMDIEEPLSVPSQSAVVADIASISPSAGANTTTANGSGAMTAKPQQVISTSAPGPASLASRFSHFEDPTINLPIDIRMSITGKNKGLSTRSDDLHEPHNSSSIRMASNSTLSVPIMHTTSTVGSNVVPASLRASDQILADIGDIEDRLDLQTGDDADNEEDQMIPDFDDADIAGLDAEFEATLGLTIPSSATTDESNVGVTNSVPLTTERSSFMIGMARFSMGGMTGSTKSDTGVNISGSLPLSTSVAATSPRLNIAETSSVPVHTSRASFGSEMSFRIKVHNPSSMSRRNANEEDVSSIKAAMLSAANSATTFQAATAQSFSQLTEEEITASPPGSGALGLDSGVAIASAASSTAMAASAVATTKPRSDSNGNRNRYVGDSEYFNLSVLENLELYFQEQVFQPDRPIYESPYIRLPTNSDAYRYGGNDGKDDIAFVPPANRPERCLAIYHEPIIEVTPESVLIRESWSRIQPVPGNLPDSATAIDTSSNTVSSTTESSFSNGESVGASEVKLILVLTDLKFYLVKFEKLRHAVVFNDAPIPILLRSHDIYTLTKCTIFFGFQRCILSFANTASTYSPELMMHQISDTTGSIEDKISYVILTRDKSKTYSIITKIPKTANAARLAVSKTLSNVQIANMDAELLDSVMRNATGLGLDPDIVHYQLLHQVAMEKASSTVSNVASTGSPRSLILTSKMILLCDEQLDCAHVNLKILESANIRDIVKIQNEDNPCIFRITLKSQTLFGKRRKWRLRADNRQAVIRFQEDCRRVCQDSGVVFDS